jgi:hypothetical protein
VEFHSEVVMKLIVVVFSCLLLVPAVCAQYQADSQSGDLIFYKPMGWELKDSPRGALIVAPLTPPSKAFIALLPATDLQADLPTTFSTAWAGLQRQYRVVRGGQSSPWHSKKGIDGMTASAIVEDRSRAAWVMSVYIGKNGKRAETVLYMSNVAPDSGLGRTTAEILGHVLDSLGFANGPGDPNRELAAKPVPLPKGTGKFNGLYRAIGQIDMNPFMAGTPGNPYKYKVGYKYVVFFPDGRFSEGFPGEGLDQLDEDTAMRRNPVGWGSYQMSGELGRITFLKTDPHDKQPIVWSIREISGGLEVQGDKYYPIERSDGLKLQGTFRRADYKSLSVGARQGITFFPDGRFSDEGVFKAAFVMVRNPISGHDDFDDGAPGRGTYRIENFTLQLNYANGRTKRTSLFIEPGKPRTDVSEIKLNTYSFARVP